ncbi:unnamed protein product [Gadus morhua 'NCC']
MDTPWRPSQTLSSTIQSSRGQLPDLSVDGLQPSPRPSLRPSLGALPRGPPPGPSPWPSLALRQLKPGPCSGKQT